MPKEVSFAAGVLSPLREVRADNLERLFGSRRIAYVVDYPAVAVLADRGISLSRPMDTSKKAALLSRLPACSFIVSPGVLGPEANRTMRKSWYRGMRTEKVVHLPMLDVGGVRRVYSALRIFGYLLSNRAKYDAVLCYNSYAHTLIPTIAACLLLRRDFFIDWQDDYRLQPGNFLTKSLWPLARRLCSGGIATNARMLDPGMQNWLVVEAYCDLKYARSKEFEFKNGMHLLFSGTLDRIRGAHLLAQIITAIGEIIEEFTLDVTGGGELAPEVKKLSELEPRLRYHGFVTNEELARLVIDSDACLVLQDPAHAFSKGSFPSKVAFYAQHKKPILMLRSEQTGMV